MTKKIFSVITILAMVWSFPAPAFADLQEWTGGNSGAWDLPANWNSGSGPVPASTDDTVFDTTDTRGTITLGGAASVGSVSFNTTVGMTPYTIGALGTDVLTLHEGGYIQIENSAPGTQTIAAQVSLSATGNNQQIGQFINNSNGAGALLNITGPVTIGSGSYSGDYVTLTGAYNGTISGNISDGAGTLGVTKSGNGTWTLSGANSYTGATTVTAGTLEAGIEQSGTTGAFGNNSAVTLNNADGGGLNLNNYDETIGSLNGVSGSTIQLGSGTLTTGGLATTDSYAGVISGSGGLTKVGAGTLTLSGNNGYTGGTNINGGVLQLTGNGSLGSNVDTNTVSFNNGGMLEITSGIAAPITSAQNVILNGNGTIQVDGTTGTPLTINGTVSLGSNTLTVQGAGYSAINGVISGAGDLIEAGTSSGLYLGGANSYTGATIVNSGTITAGIGQSGTTGAFGNNSAVTLNNTDGGGLNLNNYDETIGSLNGVSGSTIQLGSGTLTTGGLATPDSYAGVISGSGGLTKIDAGTFTLSGNNTYTGGTNINGGVLQITGVGNLGSNVDTNTISFNNGAMVEITSGIAAPITSAQNVILNGNGTIQVDGTTGTPLTLNGTVSLGSNTLTVQGAGTTAIYGVISGAGGLIEAGTSSGLYLGGANAYTGATIVNSGTITAGIGQSGATGAFGNNSAVTLNNTDGGGLNLNSYNVTIGSLNGVSGSTIQLGSGTLTTGGLATTDSYAGVISGVGGALTKVGAGTFTLSGNNGYTGGTNINGGVLRLTGNGSLGSNVDTNTISFNNGGMLEITSGIAAPITSAQNVILNGNGTIQVDGTTGTPLTINGTVSLGSDTLTMQGTGNVVLGGDISGLGGLTMAGTGTLTLGGTGNVYSGVTTINSGTLVLNEGAPGDVVFGGDATVDLAGGTNIGGSVTTNADDIGTLNITAGGSSTITGTVGAGGSQLKAIEIALASAQTATFQGAVTAGAVAFTSGDGTAIFNGNVNLSGTVTNATGTDSKGEIDINGPGSSSIAGQVGANGARLREIEMDVAVAQAATFSGDVYATTTVINGTGTTNFNGNVSSNIQFNANGTINVADGKSISGTVTNTSGSTTGTLTFLGASATGGDIGAAGSGNDLSAVNIGNGITGGVVVLQNDIYATDTTVYSGATLSLNGSHSVNGNLTVSSFGAVSLGANLLTVNGNYNASASNTTLNLSISSASVFGHINATGTAALNATSTLNLTVLSSNIPNGTTFTVINGAGGAGPGGMNIPSAINVLSSPLTFTATTAGGELILTSHGSSKGYVPTNGNAAAVMTTLEFVGATTTNSDMLSVLAALGNLSNAQLQQALDTMHPDTSGAAIQGARAVADQFIGSVGNRQAGVRTGVSTGDETHGIGFWTEALGSHVHQGTLDGIEGFQANAVGTTVGVDKLIDNHVRVGLAAGYGFADVNSKTPGSPTSDINSFQGTLYGSYDSLDLSQEAENEQSDKDEASVPKEKQGTSVPGSKGGIRTPRENSWYVDGLFAFTQNDFDSSRNISLGTDERTASADHYGQQYSTQLEAGYTFVFEATKALQVTPFTSLQYSYLYLDSYNENGAGSLDLQVNGQGYNQLLQSLGTKFAYPFEVKNAGTFVPSLKTAWLYDYIGDKFESTSSFEGGGPSFTTDGVKPAQNGLLLGAQFAFLNKRNMTLTVNYDLELKDAYSSNTYYATARFDF